MLPEPPSAADILARAERSEVDAYERVQQLLRDDYWPCLPYRSEEYAGEALARFSDHIRDLENGPIGQVMWDAYSAYHLIDQDGGYHELATRPIFAGEQGEILLTRVPHFRSLVQHTKALISADRVVFEPQASNSDGKAMQQVNTARHVLDYSTDQRGIGQALRTTCENQIVVGAGYIHLAWDPYAGTSTGGRNPVTKQPVMSGDLTWDALCPWDVAHQPCSAYKDAHWHIVRTWHSPHELAARLLNTGDPLTAEKVLTQSFTDLDYRFTFGRSFGGPEAEKIPVYHVYHDRTAAVPMGRMSTLTGDGIVLRDGPLPYPQAPVIRMCANEFMGTSLPFANAWGWMVLETLANTTLSAIGSRMEAFGSPIVSVPEGDEWGVDDLQGFRLHSRKALQDNRPELIDFAQMSAAIPNSYQLFVGEMQRVSGINSVIQGAPADNLNSGNAMALVAGQAHEYASDPIEAYNRACEQTAEGVIQIYQSRASDQLLISVAGKEGEPTLQTFQSDAISQVKRVTVKRASPLTKTMAAKQQAAEQLLANGLLRSPEEYMSTLETGVYSSIFSDDTKKMALIREENAMLLRGEAPTVGSFEPFHLHVQEHAALEDMYAKSDPDILRAIQIHVGETLKKWQDASIQNPALLKALNVPLLPPPPQVQMAMQQQGIPSPDSEMQGMPKKPGPKPAPQVPGVDNKVKGPDQPNMPEPAQPPEVQK